MLGDLAIDGGNFTTAHLKTQTIRDLFSDNAESKQSEQDDAVTAAVEAEEPGEEGEAGGKNTAAVERKTMGAFESAIAAVEDVTDKEVLADMIFLRFVT